MTTSPCYNTASPLGLSVNNVSLSSGLISRGIGFAIGTPQQVVALQPATSADYTWVVASNNCKDEKDYLCIGGFAGVYNSTKSSTYQAKTLNAWNGTVKGLTSLDSWNFFNDDVKVGSNPIIPGFPVLMKNPSTNNGIGGIGIGRNSTFLDQLVKLKQIPYRAWGLWVGSRSINNPVNGALWLGGYDSSRVNGKIVEFDTTDNCEQCVVITNLTYSYNGGSAPLFPNSSYTLTVNMQPFAKYLEVPNEVMRMLIAAGQKQGSYQSTSNGFVYFNNNQPMGDVIVTLKDKSGSAYTTTIPGSELFFPPRGVDAYGTYAISNNTYTLGAFYNTTYTGYILDWGIPFLTMNYMIMDHENKIFKMAPARQGAYSGSNGALVQPLCSGVAAVNPTATVAASSTVSPLPTDAPSGGSSTNVGAIAGGVAGGVAGIIIIAVLAWFLLRSKKKQKALKEERDAAVAHGSEPGFQQERMSQYTGTSPTEVSQVYAGGKAYGYNHNQYPQYHQQPTNNVNAWLHSQDTPATRSEIGSPVHTATASSVNNDSYASPTAASPTPMSHQNQHASANMNAPFEMPAYPYK